MLLDSDEPSVRCRLRAEVLGEDESSRPMRELRREITRSPRVRRLLDGVEALDVAAYSKWQGSHWVLISLAELGHPGGDARLEPLRDQVLATWLATRYLREFTDNGRSSADRYRAAVPVSQGRYRRCGSQQGGALFAVVRLGLDDGRAAQLVERLLLWQWPDGGWNCDRRPEARSSSVHETLLPMRGLHAFATATGDRAAAAAAGRAAEVFLSRGVVHRRSAPTRLGRANWGERRDPAYWHHGLRAGLKGMAEVGALADERCARALDLLEAKRLPDGGWSAEGRWHKAPTASQRTSGEHVDWGTTSTRRPNLWVTLDALSVLAAAGRLDG